MESHAEDLRAETDDVALVNAIKHDYQTADIAEKTRVMLDFVVRVTTGADEVMEEDIDTLREAGFGDEGILSITHITGYFNHINRLADALGVEPEDFMKGTNGNRTG